jgi:hypothetical protein
MERDGLGSSVAFGRAYDIVEILIILLHECIWLPEITRRFSRVIEMLPIRAESEITNELISIQ